MSVSVVEVFKRFDAYPKTLEDFRIKTFSGGTITVISAIVMILLFASEIQDYLTPGIAESLGLFFPFFEISFTLLKNICSLSQFRKNLSRETFYGMQQFSFNPATFNRFKFYMYFTIFYK